MTIPEAIKRLVSLSKEKGFITYDDVNNVLPDDLGPEELDELYNLLLRQKVNIVESTKTDDFSHN